MFAVLFEVQPKPELWDEYLDIARVLKPELEAIPGFIANERFRSRRSEGRLLSLSVWANEKAVVRWRTHAGHHGFQGQGRARVFADYRLRVGEITSDTHLPAGHDLRQMRFDTTEIGAGSFATITEAGDAPPVGGGLLDAEVYDSIATEGRLLVLLTWRDEAAAAAWVPPAHVRHRGIRIIREYGLADRREAPQYFGNPSP